MRPGTLLVVYLLLGAVGATAQNVGIGTTTPAASAQLDVSSSSKGFLPPRMLAADRDAISNPEAGLIIYCFNCGVNGEWQGYNGTAWTNLNGATATPALIVGDTYKGGKIAYIFQPGDPGYIAHEFHGLIATINDVGGATQWGCTGFELTGADGILLGTGNQNTIDIMAGCGAALIAARKCGDLVTNGYSDWYLPSKDELNKLYINKVAIGNLGSGFYWSSSEVDDNFAWAQLFSSGLQSNIETRNSTYAIRAIRSF